MILNDNNGYAAVKKSSYRTGEEKAMSIFQLNGWNVVDQSQNSDYWKKDIDFIAYKGNEIKTVEVKWDNSIASTGNMFIELLTDERLNKPGWITFCQADIIMYGSSHENLFYVFATDDLREYLKTYENRYQTRKAIDYDSLGRVRKLSIGALIPIEEFCQLYPVEIMTLPS